MQVSVENLDEFKRVLNVVVSAEEVKKTHNAIVKRYTKGVSVKGFRKGHVPADIIMQKYGKEISQEVAENILRENTDKALRENLASSSFADSPAVSVKGAPNPEKDWEFTISVELMPSIELKPLDSVSVEKVICSVSDEDVDNMIKTLRLQHSKWHVEDDLAVENDTAVNISFEGKVDGQDFRGNKADNFMLTVGITPVFPGFVEGLMGHKAGEELTVNTVFPDNYQDEALRGKSAVYNVKIKSVARREIPEFNADFLSLFNFKGTEEEFRADLKSNMKREAASAAANSNRANLSAALAAAVGPFALPPASVIKGKHEMVYMQVQSLKNNSLYKVDEAKEKELIAEGMSRISDEAAAGYVRQQYVFNSYVKNEDASGFGEAQIRALIEDVSGAFDSPKEFINTVYKDRKAYNYYSDQAFLRFMVEQIMSRMQVSEKQMSFSDLLPGSSALAAAR